VGERLRKGIRNFTQLYVVFQVAAMTRSEDVSEYKGTLPVDELLAFINDDDVIGDSSGLKAESAASSSKKDRSVRRKKKPGIENQDSVVNSADTGSGYEMAGSDDGIADSKVEVRQSSAAAVPPVAASAAGVWNAEFESAAAATTCDLDRFVVVQKKKKVRQPALQLAPLPKSAETKRYLPPSSRVVVPRDQTPVSTQTETARVDKPLEVVSSASVTDSNAGYIDDNSSTASAVPCSSPDFPNLRQQPYSIPACHSLNASEVPTGKPSTAPSTISYAIVAAGGLRPNTTSDDVAWEQSFESSADSPSCSEPVYVSNGIVIDDDVYCCDGSTLAEHSNPSRMDDSSSSSTPTGYCLVANPGGVFDDLVRDVDAVDLRKVAERFHVDAGSVSDAVLACSQPSKLPVVFLDIASECRSGRNSLGVSFGFDSADVTHSECSSSESGFSDCTVHTDTSAASPSDLPSNFTSVSSCGVLQTVTVAHCRPIIPFLTTAVHPACSHTPVGIVPPIPQVAEHAEELDSKAADIMKSVGKDVSLHRELAAVEKQLLHDKLLSSNRIVSPSAAVCGSVPVGSFNLFTAQIFLYTGN